MAELPLKSAAYRGGRPWIAGRLVRRQLAGLIPGLFFFVALPIVGLWAAFQPGGPALLRAPVALVLAIVVAWTIWNVLDDFRRSFGLRVVVRFDRRLTGEWRPPYHAGRALIWWLERLDRDAIELGLPTFASLAGQDFDAAAGTPWFDPNDGLRTVRGVLGRSQSQLDGDVVADLQAIDAHLQRAVAQGLRFRFVVIAGTSMNGVLWEQLLNRGF